jgi:hypothetical protein
MKALAFVVGFFRRVLLVILLLFWLCVAYQFFKRGPDGFRIWYFNTVYQNTLILPPKMEWRPIAIALSVYFLFTAVLAVWEWRSLRQSK